MVREAVSNAVRHARASELIVAIEARDKLSIQVTDNGVGLSQKVRRSGLRNLDKRASECGGTGTLERGPDGGTQLRWIAPLSKQPGGRLSPPAPPRR